MAKKSTSMVLHGSRAMARTTRATKTAPKSGVHLETSSYGNPQPTYYLVTSWVATATPRAINAALFELAARVENQTIAMGTREGWIVQVDRESARVYLELAEGDEAEAKRGMEILRAVERT
jgi:D-tyrosyl-tRNA(Tyr) deacylase